MRARLGPFATLAAVQLGIRHHQLGLLLGTSPSSWSRALAGLQRIEAGRLESLAGLLACAPEDLVAAGTDVPRRLAKWSETGGPARARERLALRGVEGRRAP